MKSIRKTILVIALVVITISLGLNIWYISAFPDKPEYFNFTSIDDSKSYGSFLAEYRPLQNKIKLMYHEDSVEFLRLWTDAAKTKEKFYRGTGIERKAIAHQIKITGKIYFQIDYKQFPSDDYVFQIDGHGGRNGSGMLDIEYLPDTLTFTILEKNPIDSIGWTNYLKGQQIVFILVNEEGERHEKAK